MRRYVDWRGGGSASTDHRAQAGFDDFERHLRSEPFARLLSVIETAASAPSIECRVVSETRGLDYLAAVRAAR